MDSGSCLYNFSSTGINDCRNSSGLKTEIKLNKLSYDIG
jgi:hypothetical protein